MGKVYKSNLKTSVSSSFKELVLSSSKILLSSSFKVLVLGSAFFASSVYASVYASVTTSIEASPLLVETLLEAERMKRCEIIHEETQKKYNKVELISMKVGEKKTLLKMKVTNTYNSDTEMLTLSFATLNEALKSVNRSKKFNKECARG